MKLFGFWRSLATLRVRIALNLKGIPAEEVSVDLLAGEQRKADYVAVNPQMVVPALIDGEGPPLFQSLAILEYLNELYPDPPLLPDDPRGRARVRGLAQIVACDSQPLIVPRVREYLGHELGLPEAARLAWVRHWIGAGLRAIERNLATHPATGRYCHGDRVSIADICLVSLAVGNSLFEGTMSEYPIAAGIVDRCMAEDGFARAHPLRQPGAPSAA